ncbi:MAG: putative YigZ family protein [Cyclobacteriaceae bacterium]|jgi:uncharacterized YigZ family protein
MLDIQYKTISELSEGFYKEKGSKFISYAYPVQNQIEIKKKINFLKKQYYDARHHCFAFMVQENDLSIVRANDDGEPGHSAGDPILGQIKSFGLKNVLVVVIRYFGGTKLGVSGLIHAYKTAAEEALLNANIVTIIVKRDVEIIYPYDKTNDVMRISSEFEIEIIDQYFEQECKIIGKILPSKYEALKSKIDLVERVSISRLMAIE